MLKLFKYEGYKIVISEEAFALKPFRQIWQRDKTINKDKAIEMLENIGYYLLHDSNDNSDIFWENTAIEYFVGLVLYLFDKAKEDEINLNSVVSLSEQINNSKENIIDTIDRNSSTYQYLFNTLGTKYNTTYSYWITK